jgi:dTDP-glucose 4,6-dehydratase
VRNKRVLITGGAGFIAHHLIGQILKKTDWDVVSLDRLDYSGNLNRLHDLLMTECTEKDRKRVKIVFHDLKAAINPLIAADIGKVDYILHLAAGSHVDRSIEYPMEFVMDNVVGTCNILDYARSLDKLERFVYFSTDEVFGPAPEGIKYEENDRYNSTNPYSATKAGGEELAVAYHNTYDLPVYITHTMNVFGQRQHPEKFIPMCIRNISKGEVVTVHSDSTKTVPGSRHYIHAEDVASAILFLLNKTNITQNVWGGARCPKFNIVGSEEINNLDLARFIATVQDKELKYQLVDFHSSRPGHDLRYALDGDKMRSMGWVPQKSIRERISEVVKWTLENDRWIKL